MFESGKRPLFKGITRVSRAIGLPRTTALVLFMLSAASFMLIHSWAAILFALLWIILKVITQHDDRIFRLISLWLKSKFINTFESGNKQFNGSSYSPVSYKRRKMK